MDMDATLQRQRPLRAVRLYDRVAAARALRGVRWPAASPEAEATPSAGERDQSCQQQQQQWTAIVEPMSSSCAPAASDAAEDVPAKPRESHRLPDGQAMVGRADTCQSALVCTTCHLSFQALQDQRLHFKSDFHLLNVKRKLKGLEPIDEDKFEDVSSDISSLSGSDSSDSDDFGSDDDGNSATAAASSELDEDEADDDSISGAGVWTSNDGRLLLQNDENEVVSLFKAVVCSKKRHRPSIEELRVAAESLPLENLWAVLMTGGGHFAGAIFDSGTVVHHKTFHRYVVRAKRGTAQGAFDVKGAPAKSAGAALRRYNEQALAQEIRDLLQAWSPVLKTCHRIFIRVAGRSRRILFDNSDGSACFQAGDERIRVIPFQTRRPTFREAQRVFTLLSTLHCYPAADLTKTVSEMLASSRRRKAARPAAELTKAAARGDTPPVSSSSCMVDPGETNGNRPDRAPHGGNASEVSSEKLTSNMRKEETRRKRDGSRAAQPQSATNLQQQAAECTSSHVTPPAVLSACSSGDVALLAAEIEKMTVTAPAAVSIADDASAHSEGSAFEEPPSLTPAALASVVLNRPVAAGPHGSHCQLLHVAAARGHDSVVRLLLECGADPALRDETGKTAFQVCTEKETRNEFRRFMARYPEKYDYVEAQIPGPLTEDMERERKEKEAARRKALKRTKKENLKVKKAVEKVQQDEEREKNRYAQLSDREKRALAADRRFAEQLIGTGEQVPVLSRCWLCGKNMTGQVPFEYFDYKFCSTACLKSHRANSCSSTK